MWGTVQTEFKFLRTVELTELLEKLATCDTQLHLVEQKDRKKRAKERPKENGRK